MLRTFFTGGGGYAMAAGFATRGTLLQSGGAQFNHEWTRINTNEDRRLARFCRVLSRAPAACSAGVSPASSGGVSPPVSVCGKKRTGTVRELAAGDGCATYALLYSSHGRVPFVSTGVYSFLLRVGISPMNRDSNHSSTPRISVLISSYNNARFVEKKLAEIKA